MGFFSSKTQITVGTTISRVVEDDLLPNTMAQSIIQSALGRRPMGKALVNDIINGPVPKFNRMFQYAQNNYAFGLPNASFSNEEDGVPEVIAAIQADTGHTIALQEMFIDSVDNVFMGWKHINDHYGYDEATNELAVLSAARGYPVYLETIEAVHSADRPTNYSKFSQNPDTGFTRDRPTSELAMVLGSSAAWREPSIATSEQAIIHVIYEIEVDEEDIVEGEELELIKRESFVVDLSHFDVSDSYFHAKYTYNTGAGNQVGYWYYLDGSGSHPALDAVHNVSYTNAGTYFPFSFFRYDRVNRTDPSLAGTPEFDTTKEMLNIVGMDFEEIGESIHENDEISDVQQAALVMAVPLDSQNPVDLEYLFKFFAGLHSETNSAPLIGDNNQPKNNNVMTIQDADFKLVFSYGNTRRRTFFGMDEVVGTYSSFVDYIEHKQVVNVAEVGEEPVMEEKSFNIPQKVFRYQRTRTMYDEIRINSPRMSYVVYESSKAEVYDVTMDEGDYSNILIPLDKNICDTFTFIQLEVLYHRSLHMVFNAKVKQKLAWYETGFFRFLLTVVAIGAMFIFPPAGTPALMTALGIGSSVVAIHVLLAVVFHIIQAVIIQQGVKLLVSQLDVDTAFLAALVVAVSAIATGHLVPDSMFADNVLLLASGMVSGVQAHIQEAGINLQKEIDEFVEYSEGLQKELDELRELLDTQSFMDPFALITLRPLHIPGEAADNYFLRTMGSGNPGADVLEEIENFVDNSLRLPTIADTLKGEFYA